MKTPRLSLSASLLALATACSSGQGTGKVSLLITDAPANFTRAVVTITEIDLVGADGATVVLSTSKVTTDLLTLANHTATLVDGATVPVGAYSQLRFVISGGYVEVAGETASTVYASSPTYEGLPAGVTVGGNLQMPSYAQSGLKVDLPGGRLDVGTDARVLLVDFDVAQSFGQLAGASGQWVMHPVVAATELELSGTVDVKLGLGATAALPAGVTLDQFGAVLTNAAGSAKTLPLALRPDGSFGASFPFLVPGAYTIAFTAPAAVASFTTSAPTPAAVTVASGQPTEASFTLDTVVAAPAQ